MDLEELKSLVSSGTRPKYLFFWGHRPESDGSIGRGAFSQWWPVRFEVDGASYASAEHYMMAEKARLFGDDDALQRIVACGHPGEATARRTARVSRARLLTFQSPATPRAFPYPVHSELRSAAKGPDKERRFAPGAKIVGLPILGGPHHESRLAV